MIFSAPAEKRRDFLERNPHLRAKLRKRKRKKKAKATTTIATIENNNPEQTTPSLVQSAPPTNTAAFATEAGSKQPSKAKSNLENLVLKRKDPSKKGKLKISGKLSFHLFFHGILNNEIKKAKATTTIATIENSKPHAISTSNKLS